MAAFHELTPRQRECLRAVANHRTYKEIGRDLGISESAVEKHLRHAREKLGVNTTADAARLFLIEEREVDPQGGFTNLAFMPEVRKEGGVPVRPAAAASPIGSEHQETLRATDLDHPLSALQTLSLVGRLVLGSIAGLTLLIACAEGLKAVLT